MNVIFVMRSGGIGSQNGFKIFENTLFVQSFTDLVRIGQLAQPAPVVSLGLIYLSLLHESLTSRCAIELSSISLSRDPEGQYQRFQHSRCI